MTKQPRELSKNETDQVATILAEGTKKTGYKIVIKDLHVDCDNENKVLTFGIDTNSRDSIHLEKDANEPENWESRFIEQFVNDHGTLRGLWGEDAIDLIRQEICKAEEGKKKEYAEIFAWLLGEKGDFPDFSQKPHYSFRTELRKKLEALKK